MRILITGAAGFLGGETVRRAHDSGHTVRAMIRGTLPDEPFPSGVETILADLTQPDSLDAAVQGIEACIHCAAATSAATGDLESSRRINAGGTAALLSAAARTGRPRWIQISSMSAHEGSTSIYGRTKLEADQAVRVSTLPWTILRPSIIYGPGDRGLVGKTVGIMRGLPVVPIVGPGTQLLRPVLAGDVARAALACLAHPITVGRTYMIGGAEEITFNEFIARLAIAAGVRRPAVHLPFGMSLWIARVLGRIHQNPPLTVDNVLGVMEARSVDIEPARKDFNFNPAGFGEGLRQSFPP